MEQFSATKLLLIILTFSAFNTGLIWIIQLVHYPGFLHITGPQYPVYQQFHMRSISLIVAPAMGLELLLSMAYLGLAARLSPLYWASIACLAIIWAATFFVAVPLHGSLVAGYDASKITRLVHINWWRTISWTVRTCLLVWLLFKSI